MKFTTFPKPACMNPVLAFRSVGLSTYLHAHICHSHPASFSCKTTRRSTVVAAVIPEPEAASAECCASLRGSGGSPRKKLEFRRQILHSGRLPVQNHTSKLFSPGFGRSTATWTDFLGRVFCFLFIGTAMAVPAVPVAPALYPCQLM